jgi:Circularly permutated YpsA SLOG family
VRDSDATVLFSILPTLNGGSKRTMEFARKYKKPGLHLHPGILEVADKLRAFVQENSVKVLNVAGPRASTEPKVGQFVMALLDEVLGVPG